MKILKFVEKEEMWAAALRVHNSFFSEEHEKPISIRFEISERIPCECIDNELRFFSSSSFFSLSLSDDDFLIPQITENNNSYVYHS